MADTGEQGQGTNQAPNWAADLQLRSQTPKSRTSDNSDTSYQCCVHDDTCGNENEREEILTLFQQTLKRVLPGSHS